VRHKSTLVLLVLLSVVAFSPVYGQGTITLDHVDGLTNDGKLSTNRPIMFHLRLNNTGEAPVTGSTNGFRLYSVDGAVWMPPVGDSLPMAWADLYDGGLYVAYNGITGSDADTIGFGGYAISGDGLAAGFDEITYTITTSFASDQAGRTICLDSSFYPPTGHWFWTYGISGDAIAGWDGPHCWTIGSCCLGLADDVNGDSIGPDIADLVHLVNFMFQQGPPAVCVEEIDVNGDGHGPDIADLVHLVTYMFQDGAPPAACR
jgi:hypothetical protein